MAIETVEAPKRPAENPTACLPRPENGDHLTGSEFLRRYERMPEVKKAELIQGILEAALACDSAGVIREE